MKDDFLRILLIIVVIVVILFVIQPSFWASHGGIAKFFGFNSSGNTTTTPAGNSKLSPPAGQGGTGGNTNQIGAGALTISSAYISADKSIKQFDFKLKAGVEGPVNTSAWKIKTPMGAYYLPGTNLSSGQTMILIYSTAGGAEIQNNSTELRYYLSDDYFGAGGTLELYNPAGGLVQKYVY